jgi:hypothetical protein
MDVLGEWTGRDEKTDFHLVRHKDTGRVLKVADLVDDSDFNRRSKVLAALRETFRALNGGRTQDLGQSTRTGRRATCYFGHFSERFTRTTMDAGSQSRILVRCSRINWSRMICRVAPSTWCGAYQSSPKSLHSGTACSRSA